MSNKELLITTRFKKVEVKNEKITYILKSRANDTVWRKNERTVGSGPIVWSGLLWSGLVLSGLVYSGPVCSGPSLARASLVRASLIRDSLVRANVLWA